VCLRFKPRSIIKKIKIIVADYSGFSRLVLSDILSTEVDLEVMDTAKNGEELISKIKEHSPDLIIADYNLPKNSRMFTFRRIQHDYNIPILMLVGKSNIPADFIFEVMKVGVYDYVQLANHTLVPQFRSIRDEIVAKARAVMDIKLHQLELTAGTSFKQFTGLPVLSLPETEIKIPNSIVVIGASTGGTKAIEQIVKNLTPHLNAAVLIALHLPERFTRTFAQRLKSLTSLRVVEGKLGTKVEAGKIIIAPGDINMTIYRHLGNQNDLRVQFSTESVNEFDCPSVDVLMKSVAVAAGPQTLGIILTGMGVDGTKGAKAILDKGGETVAQDEASSTIFGMAKSAIEKGYINKVLSLHQIPDYINRFAEYHQI